MKTFTTVLASATLVLAAAVPGQASDQARFNSLVRKYVPEYNAQFTSFAPKTACICEPGGMKAVGVMLEDSGFANCLVPSFVNGSLTTFYACASYQVLGK